ncbi:hypothetical protein HDU76_006386 [Blyttiomyces sp. JEL0837]|nr:hypothetical protein HDU76_006386 [Blyttiomyces sp. JEL0837]
MTCPLCDQKIATAQFADHYKWEKDLLLNPPSASGGVPDESRKRRGAAIVAAKQILTGSAKSKTVQHFLSDKEQFILKIKSNRLKRLSQFGGTLTALNEHVDECLSKQSREERLVKEDAEAHSSNFEEYTWAGQTRIRATALVEGGYEANGFIVHKRSDKDTDEDVDIDDDDETRYGMTQYNEDHIRNSIQEAENQSQDPVNMDVSSHQDM